MTTATTERIPTGTWQVDKVHSTLGFEVKHMVVSTFRGKFDEYEAELVAGEDGEVSLTGTVAVASIDVRDDTLSAHLQSPEFFDAERHPQLRFDARELTRDGDAVEVVGELEIRGHRETVTGRGTISGPHEDFSGTDRLGVHLRTTVDRTTYGLEWNAPLPKGGFALSNEVTLVIDLEFTEAA